MKPTISETYEMAGYIPDEQRCTYTWRTTSGRVSRCPNELKCGYRSKCSTHCERKPDCDAPRQADDLFHYGEYGSSPVEYGPPRRGIHAGFQAEEKGQQGVLEKKIIDSSNANRSEDARRNPIPGLGKDSVNMPPERNTSMSEMEDYEGEDEHGMTEAGWRDKRREYTTDRKRIRVVSLTKMVTGRESFLAQRSKEDKCVFSPTWKTCDLAFTAPYVRTKEEFSFQLYDCGEQPILSAGKWVRKVSKTSDLFFTPWNMYSKIDWPELADRARRVVIDFLRLVAMGRIVLNCDNTLGGRGILVDCPLPAPSHGSWVGLTRVKAWEGKFWTSRTETLRGIDGPHSLIKEVLIPEGYTDVGGSWIDEEPAAYTTGFHMKNQPKRGDRWKLSKLEGMMVPLPIYAYTHDLADMERKAVVIDRNVLTALAGSGTKYLIVGKDTGTGYAHTDVTHCDGWSVEDEGHADIVDTGFRVPPDDVVRNVHYALEECARGRRVDVQDIATKMGCPVRLVIESLSEPTYGLGTTKVDGCGMTLYRHNNIEGVLEVEPIRYGDLRGVVIDDKVTGAPVAALSRKFVKITRGHIEEGCTRTAVPEWCTDDTLLGEGDQGRVSAEKNEWAQLVSAFGGILMEEPMYGSREKISYEKRTDKGGTETEGVAVFSSEECTEVN